MLIFLTILVAITQVGDWYTTRTALNGFGKEGNLISKFFMDLIGVDQYLVLKGILVTGISYYAGLSSIYSPVITILVYIAVLYNNFKVIKKI